MGAHGLPLLLLGEVQVKLEDGGQLGEEREHLAMIRGEVQHLPGLEGHKGKVAPVEIDGHAGFVDAAHSISGGHDQDQGHVAPELDDLTVVDPVLAPALAVLHPEVLEQSLHTGLQTLAKSKLSLSWSERPGRVELLPHPILSLPYQKVCCW